jgi:acylphosphatase
MSDTIRHVTVGGRVQGVGYRYFVEQAARSHDIEGWVRNRRDGSVEAVFAGPEQAVTAVIAACRRGPSSARVEALRDEVASADMLNLRAADERFSVLPTV